MENTLSVDDKRTAWFDDFVAQLRVHELSLESRTATEDVTKFYESAISGDLEEIEGKLRMTVDKKNIMALTGKYFQLLIAIGKKPNQLSAKLFNNKILIWAEINDDDEQLEIELLRAEAKVNAAFYDKGYRMSTTIVEKGDNIPVPDHYQSIIDLYA